MAARWVLACLCGLLGHPAAAATPDPVPPDPLPQAVFVAPDGDDSADGTSDRPLRSLQRVAAVMQQAGTRNVLMRGGLYRLHATFRLGADAAGAVLTEFPGETPVLDGSDLKAVPLLEVADTRDITVSGLTFVNGPANAAALSLLHSTGVTLSGNHLTDTETAVLLTGTTGSTLRGNRIERSARSAMEAKDGSDGNRFELNLVDGTGALAGNGGGLFLHGASHNSITHNVVQNTAGAGIAIVNWDSATVNTDNVVEHNLVRRTNLLSRDSGAIYLLGRSGVDMRSRVAGNVIDGTGSGGDAHTIGIYLDDSASGILVENNIVTGVGTHGAQVHGGDNVTIRGNLFDLGAGAASALLFQPAPADVHPRNTMLGNEVTNNVVLTDSPAATVVTVLERGAPYTAGNILRCAACPLPGPIQP